MLVSCALTGFAQRETPIPRAEMLTIDEYDPKSTLVVPENKPTRAKFPMIDIHSHQALTDPARIDKLVKEMDELNLQVMVNLSGSTGARLKELVTAMKGRYPQRFVIFANVDFSDINEPGFGKRAAARLAEDVKNGAQGLKIFKNLGMDFKYKNGERVKVDDPELASGRARIPLSDCPPN